VVLAVAAAIASALIWTHSHRPVTVEPVADGQPSTISTMYDPQLLMLTLLLASVAGILAIVGVARIRRSQHVVQIPAADPLLPTRL
jgi:hypothetical protein